MALGSRLGSKMSEAVAMSVAELSLISALLGFLEAQVVSCPPCKNRSSGRLQRIPQAASILVLLLVLLLVAALILLDSRYDDGGGLNVVLLFALLLLLDTVVAEW